MIAELPAGVSSSSTRYGAPMDSLMAAWSAPKARKETLVIPDPRDRKGKLDSLALPVFKAQPEQTAQQAQTAAQALRALMVRMALQALKENRDRKAK